jgi:hypothetical protein
VTGRYLSPFDRRAVAFGDSIAVFHQGHGDNGQLWWNLFDGTEWVGDVQLENVGISAGPGTAEY